MSAGVAAIVPAAGIGSRVGGRRNKLFLTLAGEPLLAHTLHALQDSPAVHSIVVAVRPEDRLHVQALLRRYRIAKALPPVPGGGSRAESVASAFGGPAISSPCSESQISDFRLESRRD